MRKKKIANFMENGKKVKIKGCQKWETYIIFLPLSKDLLFNSKADSLFFELS